MRDWLRLARAPLAPTAAADAVACAFLALAVAGEGLASVSPLGWVLLPLTSLCIYGFGMIVNDLADRARDASLAPDRPLASGRIRPGAAMVVASLLGAAALTMGGGPAGSRVAVGAALGFALVYDLFAKRFLVGGAVSMGAVRFANASIAVLPLAVGPEAPATPIVFLGPAAIGAYSAAVTVWSTTEEVDSGARRLVSRILAAAAFLVAGGLPWIVSGHPTLGTLVGAGALTSLVFGRTPRARSPKMQVLEMLLGLYFLSMCLATAGESGGMTVNLGAFGVALALIWASQMLVRALRAPPAARSGDDVDRVIGAREG